MSRGPWKQKEKPKPLFVETKVAEKPVIKSTSGKEIIPVEILEKQRLDDEKNKQQVDGEVIDLTDDELKELLAVLFQEGGNVALRILRRQLIDDREAAVFGKLSLPYFRAKLKEKVNLGLTGPLIYAALVLISKPITPEEQKRREEKKKQDLIKKEMEKIK